MYYFLSTVSWDGITVKYSSDMEKSYRSTPEGLSNSNLLVLSQFYLILGSCSSRSV